MSVNFSFGLFCLLDFLTLEAVPIGCPETSVQDYHSVLHNVPEQSRSHMMIWCAGFGLAMSDPV